MAEENKRPLDRPIRVRRLKEIIILLLILSIAIPTIICGVLLVRIRGLNRNVEQLTAQIQELTQLVAAQQEELSEMSQLYAAAEEKVNAMVGDADAQISSGAEIPKAENEVENSTDDKQEPSTQTPDIAQNEVADKRKVYLTFDDGPDIYTQEILDILDKYGVKASFFVLGKESEADKATLRRIVEDGHTLGIHSYSHVYADIYASVENYAADFEKLQNYLLDVTGEFVTICRFPGGSSNEVSEIPMEECAKYLAEKNVQYFDWNISPESDLQEENAAEQIVENCTKKLEMYDTAMILLHDTATKKSTVDALPMIIENILAMEDTVILPITEDTEPVQHIKWRTE